MSDLRWVSAHWVLGTHDALLEQHRVGFCRDSGEILAIEPDPEPLPTQTGTWILTPGLINTHTHLELYADEPLALLPHETMADWILKVIARTRTLSEADKHQACHRSVMDMVRTGTTCVNDITSTGVSLDVLSQVGLRGIVSPEFFHPHHTLQTETLTRVAETVKSLQQRFRGHPLLQVGLSPHSPYNVTAEAVRAVLNQCEPSAIHTHCAETQAEHDWFINGHSALDTVHQTVLGRRFGPMHPTNSSFKSYSRLWHAAWTLVHGVYLDDEDWQTLIAKDIGVAHCYRSNMWLSRTSIPNLPHRLQQGARIGLGTDSRLSCPSLDLRDEARACQQAYSLSDIDTFKLATRGSAKAIHANQLGSIQPGFYADLVLWYSPLPAYTRAPYSLWLAPQTQAQTVWVNGRIILERDPVDDVTIL